MTNQEIVRKIQEAQAQAESAYNADYDEYIKENNGDEPNWDNPVIFWDGEKAGWFWGGDASVAHEHLNDAKFEIGDTEETIIAKLFLGARFDFGSV